jgi:hypothetical protein
VVAGAQTPEAKVPDAGSTATLRLPRQGLDLQVRKEIDRSTGEESVTATLPDGRAVDYFAALRTELATGASGLLFELRTSNPYRNKIRFRPAGGGYIATFEGP